MNKEKEAAAKTANENVQETSKTLAELQEAAANALNDLWNAMREKKLRAWTPIHLIQLAFQVKGKFYDGEDLYFTPNSLDAELEAMAQKAREEAIANEEADEIPKYAQQEAPDRMDARHISNFNLRFINKPLTR